MIGQIIKPKVAEPYDNLPVVHIWSNNSQTVWSLLGSLLVTVHWFRASPKSGQPTARAQNPAGSCRNYSNSGIKLIKPANSNTSRRRVSNLPSSSASNMTSTVKCGRWWLSGSVAHYLWIKKHWVVQLVLWFLRPGNLTSPLSLCSECSECSDIPFSEDFPLLLGLRWIGNARVPCHSAAGYRATENRASQNPRISHHFSSSSNCKLGVAMGCPYCTQTQTMCWIQHRCSLAHNTFSSCRKPAESLLLPLDVLDFRTQQLPKKIWELAFDFLSSCYGGNGW